jgi:hypothetical protein
VRRFPAGGGKLLCGAGPVAQFDERIGLALRDRTSVGDPVGSGGAAGGELLDQSANLGAVLGVEPAFQG